MTCPLCTKAFTGDAVACPKCLKACYALHGGDGSFVPLSTDERIARAAAAIARTVVATSTPASVLPTPSLSVTLAPPVNVDATTDTFTDTFPEGILITEPEFPPLSVDVSTTKPSKSGKRKK